MLFSSPKCLKINDCLQRLCPRPHWKSLQRSSEHLAGFKEPEVEQGGMGRYRKKRGRKDRGGGRENLFQGFIH